MRAFVLIVFVSLLMAHAAIGQHGGHDHALQATVKPAAAQCILNVRLLPETGVAEVWMELEYRNQTDRELVTLQFSLPEEKKFSLDSILYLGAPLDSSKKQIRNGLLTLFIPLKPGEMAPLLLSFKTKIVGLKEIINGGQAVVMDGWYPQPLVQKDSTISLIGGTVVVPDICDFRVQISVDSSLQVAAPGTFINEIESFGPLSERIDSIYYDPQESVPSPNHAGPSTKSFYFQLTGAENFSLSLIPNPSIVRVMYQQQRVDLYSTGRVARADQEKIAREISSIARSFVDYLGPIPDGRMAVLFDRRERLGSDADRFAYISTSSRDPQFILTQFAVSMAYQYFNRVYGQIKPTRWSDGAAIWVAATILHDLYGDDGYAIMEKWLDQALPEREIHSPFTTAPFGWMNNLRKPNRPWGQDDSLLFERYFVTPSVLQMVAAYTSTDSMMSALRRYSLENRNRHPEASELPKAVATEIGTDWSSQLQSIVEERGPFDWSLEDVKISEAGNGYTVAAEIHAGSRSRLLIEIGVISGKDTTVVIQSPFTGHDQVTPLLIESALRPTAVVLDPKFKLPDQNRQNNIYNANATNLRLRSVQKQFPTYKRFTRGD